MKKQEINKFISNEIPHGFDTTQLSFGDKETLNRYISKIKFPNCYLEIGTFHGHSAWIASESNPNIEIYTIDILDQFKLKDNKQIHFINKSSVEASMEWDGKPIGVLFIDGDHTKALEDFISWEKYVVKNGIILFHDYSPCASSVQDDCIKIITKYPYRQIMSFRDMEVLGTSIFQIKKL